MGEVTIDSASNVNITGFVATQLFIVTSWNATLVARMFIEENSQHWGIKCEKG